MNRPRMIASVVLLCSATLLRCWAFNQTRGLIWAQSPLIPLPLSSLVQIRGDPASWMQGSSDHPAVEIFSKTLHNWGCTIKGLDFSFRHNLLVWSETVSRKIQMLSLDSPSLHPLDVLTGTSSEVNAVAVDWLSLNVYWTDALYNWLVMAPVHLPMLHTPVSQAPRRIFKIVLQEELDNPHGVAVFPKLNWLFLSDWGVRPRIERMNLLGGNRKVLVDSDILAPQALVIDVSQLRLFWTDYSKGTVESIFLLGLYRRRTLVLKAVGSAFFDMAFYKDYLFLTDQTNMELKVIRADVENQMLMTGGQEAKEDGEMPEEKLVKQTSIPLGERPYGIIIFDGSLQPGFAGICEKAGCEQMCVEMQQGTGQCLCGQGYDLMDDLIHCIERKSFPHPTHLYSVGLAICIYPATVADMDMNNVSLSSQCGTITSNLGYLALAFHAGRNLLFFSSNLTRAIFAMTMEPGSSSSIVVTGTGLVRGLSVDWVTGLLWWTDSTRGQINVARMDGSFQTVVVSSGVVSPLGIVVHPRRGKVYWTDVGSPGEASPAVDSINMDGSDRQSLNVTSDNLGHPNHLFIDYSTDRLYWTDSKLFHIMQYDLNSQQWTVFFEMAGVQFYGISLYKDYLLWTDSADMNGIHIARVDKKKKVRGIIHPGYGEATDLITVDATLQPDMASPCRHSETLCDQLCLPQGQDTHSCRCGLGFTLQDEILCTAGDFSQDNFLLVADPYQHNIYQIDVMSGIIRAATRGERHQPMALDYLPLHGGVIFWSDNVAHVIRRQEVGLTWPSTFVNLPENSKVEGLAVDVTHLLLYYTDTGRDIIGVVDIKQRPSARHAVLIEEGLTNPRDIVVFSRNGSDVGKIYWADWGTVASISEAQMTGENHRVLLTFNHTAWLNGLTLDRKEEVLYWADSFSNSIGTYDLRTCAYRIVLTTSTAHFYDMFLMGDFLYITDWRKQYILRMPKRGGSIEQFGEDKFNKLYGITGYNSSEVPQVASEVCDDKKCPVRSICLPGDHSGYLCICVVGYFKSGDKCVRNFSLVSSLDDVHKQFYDGGFEDEEEKTNQLVTDRGISTKVAKGQYAGVVVVCVSAVIVFCAALTFGILGFVRRRHRETIPHARLGLGNTPAGGIRAEAPSPPIAVGTPPTQRVISRIPAVLAHLKVIYTRSPASEHVRFEEGFDNPSYDEASLAMMSARQASSTSSDDNQPSV